jgi:hypothetical protein
MNVLTCDASLRSGRRRQSNAMVPSAALGLRMNSIQQIDGFGVCVRKSRTSAKRPSGVKLRRSGGKHEIN